MSPTLQKISVFGSGIVLAVSFSYTFFWPIGIISLAFLVHTLRATTSTKEGAVLGGLFSIPFVAGSLSWWFAAFPLTSIGINDPFISVVLLVFPWIVIAIVLSIPAALCCAIFVLLKKNKWYDTLLFASLWVIVEILRTVSFLLLSIGPESLSGFHWTFGFTGYILTGSTTLLQLAAIGGVYLLGFVFAFLAAALVYTKHSLVKRLIASAVFVVLFSIPFLGNSTASAPSLKTIVTKTSEDSYFSSVGIDRRARFQRINNILAEALPLHTNLDLIVLPEDSRFLELQYNGQLKQIPIGNTTYILDSSRVQQSREAATMRVMTYSHSDGFESHYTKRLLVAGNEYLSYLYSKIIILVGLSEKVERFAATKAYSKGNSYVPTYVGSLPVAASLCSEIYSPHIQQNLAKNSGMLINMGSHSRLKGADTLFNQVVAMSKVRAVENGKYLVRSTNFDDSFVISSTGKVVAMTNSNKPFDFIYYEVPILYERTLFSRTPYAVPILSLVIVMIFFIRRKK